jgi:hypothetical protein
MDEQKAINEVSVLLDKIMAQESLIVRAEQFYDEHHEQWPDGVASYFLDVLERKRDMVYYEWDRLNRMGQAIATGRDRRRIDI